MPQNIRSTAKILQKSYHINTENKNAQNKQTWNFNEFFMYTKDKNVWTNIKKQHEEASLESINNTKDGAELELDSSFISLDEEEIIYVHARTHAITGP